MPENYSRILEHIRAMGKPGISHKEILLTFNELTGDEIYKLIGIMYQCNAIDTYKSGSTRMYRRKLKSNELYKH